MKKKLQWKEHCFGSFQFRKLYCMTAMFLMVLGVLQVQATDLLQERKISLSLEEVTLKVALNEIEVKSGLRFVYINEEIDDQRKVNISADNVSVKGVLDDIFSQSDIAYIQKGTQIVLRKSANLPPVETNTNDEDSKNPRGAGLDKKDGILYVNTSKVQYISKYREITVKGKVVGDDDGESLPGVNVLIKGTSVGTVTDLDGNYTIEAPNENATLVFSFVGYKTQEVPVNGRSSIDVELLSDISTLSEVVVVGYGTQERRDVTGSVSQIKTDEIENMPNTDITQMLQGRVGGLNITNNASTAEGGESNIQIRGRNSINASNRPLIILDNVPYGGGLNEINPEDIESLEILKDASSAAIYGSRGANGVIIVTTKKGQTGKPKISYSGFHAIDEMGNQADLMNASEWYALKSQRPQTQLSPSEIRNYMNGVDTDWVDLATQQGQRMQHNLSFSGGSDNTTYLISANYNSVEGIAINDKFDRLTLRVNLETKINDFITYGTNTQFGSFDRSGFRADFDAASRMNPLGRPYEDDGETLRLFPWEDDVFFRNPLENLNVSNNNTARSVLTNNYLNIDIPFVKGLSYRLNTGYNYRASLQETYKGRNTVDGFRNGGDAEVINNNSENILLENIINYKREFGAHSIFLTGLYSSQEETEIAHRVTGVGFPSDIQTVYQMNSATTLNASDNFVKRTYISQMLRANYGYDGKYLLTLTARRDGYSGFGADTKFGVFPSLGLAWNIYRESFMNNVSWVDNLKLRFSYGMNGNQAVGAYSTTAQLQIKNYLNADGETVIGYYPRSLGDPTLGWETTLQTDIGVDFDFFKGRIQGSFDWFDAQTTDLLLDRVISPVNGTRSIRQNIGETRNTGFEFNLNTVNFQRGEFTWTTGFNISRYKNEIVNIGLFDEDGNPLDNLANQWFVGQPIDVNYGYVFDGIWQQEDADDGTILNSADPNAKPGQVKAKDDGVRDEDGNLSLQPEDRQIIGSRVPLFSAGLMNTFTYGDFSLSLFFNTIQGVTKLNDLKNTFWEGRRNKPMLDYWAPDNPINSYPANDDAARFAGGRTINFYEDASFVRLNDITLSYRAPKQLIERLGISNLEIYVNAKNLATWTKWEGLDPEFSNQRFIPINKTYLLGLRFGL